MTFPRYDENWRLIRSLWPRWIPNDDEVALYAKRFDKPHGVAGTEFVDQVRLREAIELAKETETWGGAPDFASIVKHYRQRRNDWMRDLARQIPGAVTDAALVARRNELQKEIEQTRLLLEAKPKQIEGRTA